MINDQKMTMTEKIYMCWKTALIFITKINEYSRKNRSMLETEYEDPDLGMYDFNINLLNIHKSVHNIILKLNIYTRTE